MTSMKNALAAVGLVFILAVSGIGIGLILMTADSPTSSEDWTAEASTDGLTYDQIQTKLNHYADILNAGGASIILSGDVWTEFPRDGVSSYNFIPSSGNTVTPVSGSAKVVDGDLKIRVALPTGSSSYASSSGSGSQTYDLLIPYHSIVAIKTTVTS